MFFGTLYWWRMNAWFDNDTSVDCFEKVSEFTVISQKFDTLQGTWFFFIVLLI